MAYESKQLVSQFLEGVSKKALEKYQDIVREFVHKRHGIYALHRRGKLYYVGLASNLRSRLRHHLEDRLANSWDTFNVYLTIDERHMRQLEALVLRIASPKGNRQKGGLGKADNVKGRFRKAITAYHRQELESLFSKSGKIESTASKKLSKRSGKAKLAGYADRPLWIKMRHLGKTHWARIRANGMIVVKGRKFSSPSRAAQQIVGHGINGWQAWHYLRAPGDWVPLSKLRE